MSLDKNERLQEIFLVVGDRLSVVSKIWWYVLLAFLVLLIPSYFILKSVFTNLFLVGYAGPQMIYSSVTKEPLQILEKKIFEFPDNSYSGYVKIKNINLEWGVASQDYEAVFKTFGGTVINKVNRSTFILPSSEKLIVLPRFASDKKPDEIALTLGETHFIHKPEVSVNFEVARTSLQNGPDGLVVSSAFKNLTPFTIKEIGLPVAVFNNKNEIVAANFTYINEVRSSETRTFQYSWSGQISGAVRAEINPEVNIFDRNVFSNEQGNPQFNSAQR